MQQEKLYRALTYAGTLPFVATAALPYFGRSVVPGLGSFADVAAAYGLAIVSFMAGTHWGIYLLAASRAPMNLFLTSNLVTVIVWLSYLAAGTATTLAALAAAFVVLLLIELPLLDRGMLSRHYFRVRLHATTIAVVSLTVTIVAL